jgi:hypothetical protein
MLESVMEKRVKETDKPISKYAAKLAARDETVSHLCESPLVRRDESLREFEVIETCARVYQINRGHLLLITDDGTELFLPQRLLWASGKWHDVQLQTKLECEAVKLPGEERPRVRKFKLN